jgi:hypothetical protein
MWLNVYKWVKDQQASKGRAVSNANGEAKAAKGVSINKETGKIKGAKWMVINRETDADPADIEMIMKFFGDE